MKVSPWTRTTPAPNKINTFHDFRPHSIHISNTGARMSEVEGGPVMGAEGRDIEALRGIVTTLVSLARLAQCAAGLPFPLRFVLLAILRLAESVAREFVVEEMAADWFGGSPEFGNRPADATLLAMRFCALAEAIVVLIRLEWACLTARPDEALPAIVSEERRVTAIAARRLPLPLLRGPPALGGTKAPILHARLAAQNPLRGAPARAQPSATTSHSLPATVTTSPTRLPNSACAIGET